MADKNLCGKMVTRENAYEIWQTPDGSWTWYVLKKYQSPEKDAENPYARWFCLVTSPFVGEQGEMGDVYVRDIKGSARMISKREVTAQPTTKAAQTKGARRVTRKSRSAMGGLRGLR